MEIGINKRFLPCSILSVNRDLDSGELSYVPQPANARATIRATRNYDVPEPQNDFCDVGNYKPITAQLLLSSYGNTSAFAGYIICFKETNDKRIFICTEHSLLFPKKKQKLLLEIMHGACS